MLSVIFIWFYMAATAFLLGYGILTGLSSFVSYRVKRWDGYVICGLAGATVYAQFFSIFAPVGLAANLLLIAICLFIAFLCRKRLREGWKLLRAEWRAEGKASGGKIPAKGFLLLFLFLLYAYGTSRGVLHYDTALYHAQSIRWIEEYGIVKGLGNLHCRLAYNSASFALSALYGMAFLGGQSYHCAAGFLAFILALVCLGPGDAVRRKRLRPSDFARVACVYYLFIIYDEMISPASDYFMVLTAFYLVIRWMDLMEEKEKEIFPYAMLCVLGVFLMTVKLSAALIILLVCSPAAALLREKRWKETAVYTGLGLLTAAPFLIRNVLLSGWLVYPFTGLDLFRVDWKIPEGIAAYDAKEIRVWGRGYSDVAKFDMPAGEWFPAWFRGLGGMDRLLVCAAMLSAAVFVLRLALWLVRREKEKAGSLFLEGVVSLCFLFWLFSSPLIRYGCVYVYLTTAVVWGDVCTEFFENGRRNGWKAGRYAEQACMLLICLFLLYKAAAFGKEIVVSYVDDYWLCQKDYDNYETKGYEISGIRFYCPVEGDRVGYESFPSSPAQARIRLRGDGIGDGFRYLE
ncbi:MAG: hypothetical protein NC341_04225 [Blautia sp.]|nr:hypothetical protein [Blautia sp.]MCM1200842.1 hypothetical protein [Bacteroides fragilis]